MPDRIRWQETMDERVTGMDTMRTSRRWRPGFSGNLGADHDAAVVIRLVGGDRRVHATTNDLTEAVRVLTGRGMSSTIIADVLGCSPRTVIRHRRRAEFLAAARTEGRILVRSGQYALGPDEAAWSVDGHRMVPRRYGRQYRWVRSAGGR